VDVDDELDALTAPAVTCRRCGVPFPEHGDAGGPVRVRVGGWASPADAVGLTCAGFLWVDPTPDGPPSYGGPPSPVFS
jgi:hypothetical protein